MKQFLFKSRAENFSLFLWGSLVFLIVTSRNQLWNCTHFGILPAKKSESLSSIPFELSLFSRIIWFYLPSTKRTVNGKWHLIRLFQLKREPSYFFYGKPTRFYVRHLSLYTERRDEGTFCFVRFRLFFSFGFIFVLFSASYVCWGFRALTSRIIDWFQINCVTFAIFLLRPRRIKIFRIQTYKRRYTSQ